MKKFKSVLVFLLSLIICFSVFPTTVFAENSLDECTIFYSINDTTVGDHKKGKLPFNYTLTTISGYSSYDFWFSVHPVGTASDEGSLSVKFDVSLPSGCSYQKVSAVCYLAKDNEILQNAVSGNVSAEGNTFTCNFSFSEKADISSVALRFEKATFTGTKTVGLKSCTYDVTTVGGLLNKIVSFFGDLFSRLTAWFDSLFQWLKDIRDGNISFMDSVKSAFKTITDNIRNFFSELGTKLTDGFKNLTNSISTFFTNLGNNLKEWFKDVGNWFKEIGDRIGNFFTNLWNNISDSISSITTAVSDWWQSVKDFFHSLFVPEDGFFDSYKQNWEKWAQEHFALFFDIQNIFEELLFIFEGDYSEYGITIPEIKLPFFNNPVIIPHTVFYFSDLIGQHKIIEYVYKLYKIMFSFIAYGLLLVYLQKTFSKIITNDEEAL